MLPWGGINPCLEWNTATTYYQLKSAPNLGQGWNGVLCKDTFTTAAASASAEGGVLQLALAFFSSNSTMPLAGTLPLELMELRTATTINLANHALTGTIPACWGTPYTRYNYPSRAGFDQVRCVVRLTTS